MPCGLRLVIRADLTRRRGRERERGRGRAMDLQLAYVVRLNGKGKGSIEYIPAEEYEREE